MYFELCIARLKEINANLAEKVQDRSFSAGHYPFYYRLFSNSVLFSVRKSMINEVQCQPLLLEFFLQLLYNSWIIPGDIRLREDQNGKEVSRLCSWSPLGVSLVFMHKSLQHSHFICLSRW